MKQKYVIDTTALMSYFSSTFEIQNKMSQHALDIISQAFNNDSIILLIPSIVFVEIFSNQFTNVERSEKIRYEVYEKIKSCDNISIEAIDKEVLEAFLKITDIEKKYSFDNHDKLIYSTAIKYNVPLLTSDLRLKRYNKKKKMIPQIID